MNRRSFLGSLVTASLPCANAAVRPNVLLIITDDQGYGDLSCHGNKTIRTPAIDKLHSRSVRFTNFHVSPTCAPTRAALMTGRYNDATGVWHTIMGRSLLRPGEVTMADCFRASGYRTGIFGKWHLGDNYPCRPQDRGFNETVVHGGGGVWQTPDYFGNDYFDDTYWHNGKPQKYTGHCTDVWFENAQRFMSESAGRKQPFFCYLATNAPHGPMWAPDRYTDMYNGTKGLTEPGFYGMITHIDDAVSRLDEFLRRANLAENTILMFMTDNGTSSGSNVFNAGMRGAKGSAYEGGHRVPLFFSWPGGGLTGPREVDRLTAHIDVLPTMIDLCGLKRPQGPPMHGTSLKPLLASPGAAWPDRTLVTDSQREEHLIKWRQTAVMTDRWRLVNPSPNGAPDKLELYDIRKDPGQKTNVAGANPEAVSQLSARYDKWWSQMSANSDEPVRIVVGNDAENPVRLTCHDWHGEGANTTWNQRGIRTAPVANGAWALRVDQAGKYRIELRRWPKELGLPITAPYADKEPNREKAAGAAIHPVEGRIRFGSLEKKVALKGSETAAVFDLDLPPGPADLQTWFREAGGTERGAYYAYITRL